MDASLSGPLPSGTLTFVFTDIEGSTRLVQAIGPERFEAVLGDHTSLVRSAFGKHGGRAVRSEGDSFFYVFPLAASAIAAAAELQRALAAHAWPADAAIRVRIGMHTGEGRPGSAATGVDYVGPDVHRAARIAAAGHGGQTLASEPTRALAIDQLPEGVSLHDLGEHRLKDLVHPERIYQVDVVGLPSRFPPVRGLDGTNIHLPVQRTAFVGREGELARAESLLHRTRLLTLTGPGGTGKTRLSLQLAAACADGFGGGVYFVPLAPVVDPDHVPRTIAQSLALPLRPLDRPLEVLVDRLRPLPALLVLDNFEHILPAAPVVVELLGACPELAVLVTSRARLELTGEQELPIPPLRLPEADRSVRGLEACESVRLFVERARAVRPDFQLNGENAVAVAAICERLDGLPLAIELAAARIDVLPPQAIAARLDRHVPLPGTGPRDLPERQRTLDAAIGWSYALLDAAARRLFARFAVFAGGARLEEAEPVCSDGDADVLDGLSLLVRQSLLRQQEVDGGPRFLMLGTIRDFALDRLREQPDVDDVRRRHARAYLDLFEKTADAFFGPESGRWLTALDREHHNLRAALAWATTADPEVALRLVAASWRYWSRGGLAEGRRLAEEALARKVTVDPVVRVRAVEALAGLVYYQGDPAARALYEERLRLARAIGEARLVAEATYDLAFTFTIDESDAERALSLFREALESFERLGDARAAARARVGIALAFQARGDLDEALRAATEALPSIRRSGDAFTLNLALTSIARVAFARGDLATARSVLAEILPLYLRQDSKLGLVLGLAGAALLARLSGDHDRALRLAGAASSVREAAGAGPISDLFIGRDFAHAGWDWGVVTNGPADLAERALWDEGRQLSLDLAVAEALRSSAP